LISYAKFEENCHRLEARIAEACAAIGRDPGTVRLMPVTKTHPVDAAEFAARYGFASVGENRVQEAMEKIPSGPKGLKWELIGHLQSNKAKLAVEHFDRVQSVDSEKLLQKLDHAAGECGKTLPILLQVNAGDDPAKFGVDCSDSAPLLERALGCTHLKVEGLMTIAPLDEDLAVARRAFERLRDTRDALASQFGISLPELSMGMSGDIEEAIAAGSTLLRVGSALFGSRE